MQPPTRVSRMWTPVLLLAVCASCLALASLHLEVRRLRREVDFLAPSSGAVAPQGEEAQGKGNGLPPWLEKAMLELLRSQKGKDALADLGPSPPALGALPYHGKDDRDAEKGLYGGKGDALHVGGWTMNDTDGQSFLLWEYLIKVVNIKSFLDVGCGRGISSKFMLDRNVKVLCVEGSADAIKHTLLPRANIVHHDYARGPWWSEETYDLAWSVEFLEHVGRQYFENYIVTFKQAAIVFATHSLWGGFHHVEVHSDFHWFRSRFEAHGFVYSDQLTTLFRNVVGRGQSEHYTGQHLGGTSEVFINPRVASMHRHRHLFGGPGCYDGEKTLPCEGPDLLPPEFRPVWTGRSVNPDVEEEQMKVMTKENVERGR